MYNSAALGTFMELCSHHPGARQVLWQGQSCTSWPVRKKPGFLLLAALGRWLTLAWCCAFHLVFLGPLIPTPAGRLWPA